jgi:hypothetical protein
MSDAKAKTWTGGAYWHRPGGGHHPFSIRRWMTKYAPFPYVRLRLDAEGGQLLYAKRDEPEVQFGWPDVREMERVRIFALPFLGEGVRVTFKEGIARGTPKRFLFFSWSKARTEDILGFAESRGVRIERRAKIDLAVP